MISARGPSFLKWQNITSVRRVSLGAGSWVSWLSSYKEPSQISLDLNFGGYMKPSCIPWISGWQPQRLSEQSRDLWSAEYRFDSHFNPRSSLDNRLWRNHQNLFGWAYMFHQLGRNNLKSLNTWKYGFRGLTNFSRLEYRSLKIYIPVNWDLLFSLSNSETLNCSYRHAWALPIWLYLA